MEGSNRGLGVPEVNKKRYSGKKYQGRLLKMMHRADYFGRKHRKCLTAALIAIGLVLLLYPWISNYLYENRAQSEIDAYQEKIESIDTEENETLYLAAQEYNRQLYSAQSGGSRLTDPFSEAAVDNLDMESPLSYISESGAIGYLEIPVISVYLPVFEGTDAQTLLAGIGLLEGSSLPIGGESTHAVLTGHSGLSSAKMFTDLTELEDGDCFYFHILGMTLAYTVTEITVVEPDDTQLLQIREGKDLMTLVTCTPYGVNSHRLYVTGERTSYSQEIYESAIAKTKKTQSVWMAEYRKAVLLGIVGVVAVAVLWSAASVLYYRVNSGAGK